MGSWQQRLNDRPLGRRLRLTVDPFGASEKPHLTTACKRKGRPDRPQRHVVTREARLRLGHPDMHARCLIPPIFDADVTRFFVQRAN